MVAQTGTSRWQAMATLSSSLDQQQPPTSCSVGPVNSNRRGSAINFTDARYQQQQQQQDAARSLVLASGDKSANQESRTAVASGNVHESLRSKAGFVATSSTALYYTSGGTSANSGNSNKELADARRKQMDDKQAGPKQTSIEQEMSMLERNRLAAGRQPARGVGAKDETDIVFSRLMRLEAFRKLHPSVIRNLCSHALVERIEKGVIGE